MTIGEMAEWIRRVEIGAENHALLDAFNIIVNDPVSVRELARAIEPLVESEDLAYILSVGHYMAMAALTCRLEVAAVKHLRKRNEAVQ